MLVTGTAAHGQCLGDPISRYPPMAESIEDSLGGGALDGNGRWPTGKPVYNRQKMIKIVGGWHSNDVDMEVGEALGGHLEIADRRYCISLDL